MAPIGPLITLPPGLPGSPSAHAVPHAELKEPRKTCRGWPAVNKLLQNRKLRFCLHASHKAQHRISGHLRIRIQTQHEFMPARVMIQKFHHIA